MAIGLVLTYGVLRQVDEMQEANCIAEAEARFPVVVEQRGKLETESGILGGGQSGQLNSNVLFVDERQAALDDCEESGTDPSEE